MKTLISFIILTLSLSHLVAQESEEVFNKNYFLGGSLNYSITKRTDESPESFGDSEFITNSIHLGRRFSEKSAFGIRGFYNRSSSNRLLFSSVGSIERNRVQSATWRFGLFYRQYLSINDKMFLILEPNVSYSIFDSSFNSILVESERGLNVSLNVIPQYRITDRWNLFINLAGANYERVDNTMIIEGADDQTQTFNNFSFDFRLRDILVGAEWLF